MKNILAIDRDLETFLRVHMMFADEEEIERRQKTFLKRYNIDPCDESIDILESILETQKNAGVVVARKLNRS